MTNGSSPRNRTVDEKHNNDVNNSATSIQQHANIISNDINMSNESPPKNKIVDENHSSDGYNLATYIQ